MGVATQEQVANLIIGGRKLTGTEYIAAIDDVTGQSIKSILDRLGIDLVNRLEDLMPSDSGRLAGSVSVLGVAPYKDGWRLEVGFGVDYADYIDKGVKGIKNKRKTFKNKDGKHYQFKTYGMPPEALKELEGWASRKNIELQATGLINKTGERETKLRKIVSPASRLAYYIKKYGIEGRNFQQRALDDVTPFYKTELAEVGYNSLILKVSK
jgi:hypothetical protein